VLGRSFRTAGFATLKEGFEWDQICRAEFQERVGGTGAIALEATVHTMDKIKAMVIASAVVLRLFSGREAVPSTSNDGLGSQLLNL
jgi:hypothetical protein